MITSSCPSFCVCYNSLINHLPLPLPHQLEHLTTELSRMRDTLKSEKSEVYKWKDLVKELRSLLDQRNEEIERKREEVRK